MFALSRNELYGGRTLVRGSNCAHRHLVKRLGLRRLAGHIPANLCLAGGFVGALVFSFENLGSVWIGMVAGTILSSFVLAALRFRRPSEM
jgi:hypothetical protein